MREVDGRGSTSEGIGGGAAAHLHLVEFEGTREGSREFPVETRAL